MDPLVEQPASAKTRLLVGVTGSVDALLLPVYLRAIQSQIRCSLTVILTPEAVKFVNVDAIALIVERVVCGENPRDWNADRPGRIASDHDLMIVLPATANTLSAVAHGSAQNRLTMVILVATFPVIFFPVMGPTMWSKPVVRRNVETIRADGLEVREPAWREQYEPDYGRMYGHYTLPDVDEVVSIIKGKLVSGSKGASHR